MQIPIRKSDAGGKLIIGSVTDTKLAAALVTVGIPLESIYVQYDEQHPKASTGGVAHFVFSPHAEMGRMLAMYDGNDAEYELDTLFEQYDKSNHQEVRDMASKIKRTYQDSLIVSGRHFLENYRRLLAFIKSDAVECVIAGGEPAKDDQGKVIGTQGFNVIFYGGPKSKRKYGKGRD